MKKSYIGIVFALILIPALTVSAQMINVDKVTDISLTEVYEMKADSEFPTTKFQHIEADVKVGIDAYIDLQFKNICYLSSTDISCVKL